ncbi:MAG: ABC transporter ATP-binding protein [Actinomycetota bacterium]|nr:ABC transporter ATP-binding protein [Actinomycetota bacterium]
MTPVFEAIDLNKSFGGVAALQAASISVEHHRIHALIGPNGAGKTTFFNCVSGHQQPESGKVLMNGVDVTGAPPYRMAELGMARTFQNVELFPAMNVLDNVLVGDHLEISEGPVAAMLRLPRHRRSERRARSRALAALERTGTAQLAHRLAGELPYGSQRLVEIARALVGGPSVLLLDEPAAGLTAGEADILRELLVAIAAEGSAVLLVEHDMRTVMALAEEITVLDAGRVIAVGPPGQIQANPVVIAAYLGVGAEESGEVAGS